MDDVDKAQRVTISGRVPPALATELNRMAEAGNRTVSREVWAAIQSHVAAQDPAGPSEAERLEQRLLGEQSGRLSTEPSTDLSAPERTSADLAALSQAENDAADAL